MLCFRKMPWLCSEWQSRGRDWRSAVGAVKHRTCYPCRSVVRKKSEPSGMDKCVTCRQRSMQRPTRWLQRRWFQGRFQQKPLFPERQVRNCQSDSQSEILASGFIYEHIAQFLRVGVAVCECVGQPSVKGGIVRILSARLRNDFGSCCIQPPFDRVGR